MKGFRCVTEHVVVDACLLSDLAAHEGVGGNVEVLACDVPEGDVDSRERTHDRCATEMGEAVHVLPVVFNQKRVFADQVATELLDGRPGSLQKSPGARFAEPDNPLIGFDLYEQKFVQKYRFDPCDLHGTSSPRIYVDGISSSDTA